MFDHTNHSFLSSFSGPFRDRSLFFFCAPQIVLLSEEEERNKQQQLESREHFLLQEKASVAGLGHKGRRGSPSLINLYQHTLRTLARVFGFSFLFSNRRSLFFLLDDTICKGRRKKQILLCSSPVFPLWKLQTREIAKKETRKKEREREREDEAGFLSSQIWQG